MAGVEDCSICMEEYNHLKILQCNHVFCVNCIQTLLDDDDQVIYIRTLLGDDDQVTYQDNVQVTCPYDRTITTIPEGNAANLKTKFFANLNCESCCTDKSINESWWCETCGCTICG